MAEPAPAEGISEAHTQESKPSPPVIAPVSRSDVPALARLAATMTADTPTARWLVPNQQQRSTVLTAWYQTVMEQALGRGRIDVLAGHGAVAVWTDSRAPLVEPRYWLPQLAATCGRHTVMLLGYRHLLLRHQPRPAHLHLSILAGTDPAAITRLLAHRHRRLDPAGVPTHAIADSLEQRDLLTATGYQAGHPFRPAAGPQLWPMWRPPAPAQPRSSLPA